MTHTEIITQLCDIVQNITEIRENLTDADWQLDASLRDVAVRLQMAMKQMQGEKGGEK